MHTYCHNKKCQARFGIRLICGLGSYDGENHERTHSQFSNHVSNSVRMTYGNRRGHIAQVIEAHNDRKVRVLGKTLLLKAKELFSEADDLDGVATEPLGSYEQHVNSNTAIRKLIVDSRTFGEDALSTVEVEINFMAAEVKRLDAKTKVHLGKSSLMC